MSSNSSPSLITDVFIIFNNYFILYLELSDWSNYSIYRCIALHCGDILPKTAYTPIRKIDRTDYELIKHS